MKRPLIVTHLSLTLTFCCFTLFTCTNKHEILSSKYEIRQIENSKFGKILANKKGRSIYFFSKDFKNSSNCDKECTKQWPIFYAEELKLEPGLDKNDFKSITRDDGKNQTTYKGWPLYYNASDNNRGETHGNGTDNVWFITKSNYTLLYVSSQLVGRDGTKYKSDYTVGEGQTLYITDMNGRTLYTNSNDLDGKNNYTLNDFSNNNIWSIVEITLVNELPSILSKSDFSTIRVYGRVQLTYKGWPLYYFAEDVNKGDTRGISFQNTSNWLVATKNLVTIKQ